MEISSVLLALCDSPHKGPVARNFRDYFDVHLNKRLNKQWSSWEQTMELMVISEDITSMRRHYDGIWKVIYCWYTEAEAKRPTFCRRHFHLHFLQWSDIWNLIRFWLKFDSNGSIENMSVLVLVMTWHRTGDKPLTETMVTWHPDVNMLYSVSTCLLPDRALFTVELQRLDDDVTIWKYFPHINVDPRWKEYSGAHWIPPRLASDSELS